MRRYIVAAMGAGLTRDGAAPSEDQLSRLAGLNLCTPRKVETPTDGGPCPLGGPGLRDGRPVAGDPYP